MIFTNPNNSEIKIFLEQIKTIAVLGLSPKENRASFQVARALQGFGYAIIPIRPAVSEVLGAKAYPDIESAIVSTDIKIELLDVFRASQHVENIIDSCIKFNIPAVWLQDSVINHQAAIRAQAAGIFMVMDRCIYRDYINFVK